jgi:hypothetical protein
MNRHREYEPNECCVGCGRTVPASDMVREHCPQCQEDGTMPEHCANRCGAIVANEGAWCFGCTMQVA